MDRALVIAWTTLASVACARVTVEDDADACITWDTPERTVPEGIPDDASRCIPGPRNVELSYGDAVVPDGAPWTLVEICTALADDVGCEPSASVDRVARCVDEKEGEGCDAETWGGRCTRRVLWSLCGPDTSAEGGCCYRAVVVEETWTE